MKETRMTKDTDAVGQFLADRYSRAELIRAVLLSYPEQARSQAVLDVADGAGVAVFWHDRSTFEASLCILFEDAEWSAVRWELGNFDECLGNAYGVGDIVRDWMEDCIEEAGLDLETLEARWTALHGEIAR
jgi:hypothetical protein